MTLEEILILLTSMSAVAGAVVGHRVFGAIGCIGGIAAPISFSILRALVDVLHDRSERRRARPHPTEAVGDHLRVLVGRGLGVEVSDMHQVKPWFAGKIDFVPPVTFLGDDDFPLVGGDVAVFLGHKAGSSSITATCT